MQPRPSNNADTPSDPPRGYQPASKDWRASYQEASPYLSLGLQIGFSMVFFTGVGYAVDQWLDTLPLFLFLGALLGMVAIFLQIFRVSKEMNKKSAADRARREAEKRADQEGA